jgi:hypothetical protein
MKQNSNSRQLFMVAPSFKLKAEFLLSSILLLTLQSWANWQPHFIPNQGQVRDPEGLMNREVQFLWPHDGINVLATSKGFAYDLFEQNSEMVDYHRIEFEVLGAQGPIDWRAYQKQPGYIHFSSLFADATPIKVEHYSSLMAHEVYPHIDLELCISNGNFKYNWILKPEASVENIRFRINGAKAQLNELVITIQTRFGELIERIPDSFISETKQPLHYDFAAHAPQVFGFEENSPSDFAAECTQIIDPLPNRLWGSFWGGTALEFAYGMTEDNSSNVFVCGVGTGSTGFATAGAYQVTMQGPSNDAFLLKFNSSGILQWCTYFGGNNGETARGVVTSNAGDVYICGFTDSSTGIATSGAFRGTLGGGTDGFMAKFSTAGALQWATYIGGTADDFMRAITYDLTNNMLVVVGQTKSAGQATTGTHQTSHAGAGDAYIGAFTTSGAQLWSSYFGGTGEEIATAVHMQADGSILIGGTTGSSAGIASSGAHQTTYGGNIDGFMAKFTNSGSRSWSTYYGGTAADAIKGVKFDYQGNAIGIGESASTFGIATPLAHQMTIGGSSDAFVVQLDPVGARLWATYYGGVSTEIGCGVAIDTTNNIYLAAQSNTISGLATADAYQISGAGGMDALLVQFTKAGLRNWASYYGGSGSEIINGIVVNLALEMHLSGHSTSPTGIATVGTSQPNHSSGINDDPFVVKFGNLILPVSLLTAYTECNDGMVALHWKTATETNAVHFEIFVSNDLIDWLACGRIEANDGSIVEREYQFQLSTDQSAKAYYQIRLLHHDGSTQILNTGANNCSFASRFELAPNPCQDGTILSGHWKSMMVFDANGKMVFQEQNAAHVMSQLLDTSRFSNGFYVIRIFDGGQWHQRKLAVQHQ